MTSGNSFSVIRLRKERVHPVPLRRRGFGDGSVSLSGAFGLRTIRGFRQSLHPRLSYVVHLRRTAEKVSAKHQTSSIKRAPSAYCFEEAVSNLEFRMLAVGSIRRSRYCDAPCLCVSVREIARRSQGCKSLLDRRMAAKLPGRVFRRRSGRV